MTNKEAIEVLAENYPRKCKKVNGTLYSLADTDCAFGQALDKAIEALEKVEKYRWIPIHERLPEAEKGVLVTERKISSKKNEYYIDKESISNRGYWYSLTGYKVVAWMPLPEPYTVKEKLSPMRPIKQDNMYYCANCGCDVGSYGLASGKLHKDLKCRECGTIVAWGKVGEVWNEIN